MRRLILISIFFAAASVVVAGSLYVDDNAAGDPGPGNPLVSDPAEDGSTAHPYDAIQQAIDAAVNDDEVIILPGTYTGDGNRDIDFAGKAIVVTGSDPNDPNTVAATVIDCQGTETEPHRGFYFHSGETESSVLKGLTITNGYGAQYKLYDEYSQLYSVGGGVLILLSSPRLEKLIVSECEADLGGAICTSQSDSVITASKFSLCTAFMNGGGIFVLRGHVLIDQCTVCDNSAEYNAGGVSTDMDDSVLRDCRISRNTAPRGGGFYCHQSSLHLENCQVLLNVATGSGGTFANGGGIYLSSSNWGVDFRNCLFSGNYSKYNGGGIYVWGSLPVISECTIVGNRAERNGGGIFGGAGADINLRNSIIRENTAGLYGNQISLDFEPGEDDDGRSFTSRYCAYEGGLWSPDNINVDPLFADPGLWDDNGTPGDWSDDTWIEGDYHLKSWAGRWDPVGKNWVMDEVHSPCIDAADPESDYSNEPFYNGGRINIGAYGNTEYASRTGYCPEHPIGDLDGDCKVTFADLAMLAGSWQDCNLEPAIACE